jgi:hypothetical protein
MNSNEQGLFNTNIHESFRLLGLEVRLHQIDTATQDFNRHSKYTYKDAVTAHVMWYDSPEIRVLKGLGWYSEDSESLPILAYVPRQSEDNSTTYDVREGALIEIGYSTTLIAPTTTKFEISRVKSNGVTNLFYICQLVPYREDTPEEDPTPNEDGPTTGDGGNFDFLDLGGN